MGELLFIDEHRRERWLLKLEVARQTGAVAVFNALQDHDAQVLQFPERPDPNPPEVSA
jgi:hypothetical protein